MRRIASFPQTVADVWTLAPPAAQWCAVTTLSDVRPWLFSAMQSVSELAALPERWDGYGSIRVGAAALTGAIKVLTRLASAEPPMPHISPVPGGGLQLEWHPAGRYVELEVLPDGSVEYLETHQGEEADQGELSTTDSGTIRRLVESISHR